MDAQNPNAFLREKVFQSHTLADLIWLILVIHSRGLRIYLALSFF